MKNTTHGEVLKGAQSNDVSEMWLDVDIDPIQLIRRDLLDVTPELVDWAEQPELADPLIGLLPERNFNLKTEVLLRKAWREEAKRQRKKEGGD